MPNIMLHDDEARQALGRGVAKLARAVRGTLGPRGMNAIIDRPIGTPIVSRDGVSIASEIRARKPLREHGRTGAARSLETDQRSRGRRHHDRDRSGRRAGAGRAEVSRGRRQSGRTRGRARTGRDRDDRGAETFGEEPRRRQGPACHRGHRGQRQGTRRHGGRGLRTRRQPWDRGGRVRQHGRDDPSKSSRAWRSSEATCPTTW